MTDLGPVCLESNPSQAPVQDVNAEMHVSMYPSSQLVCSDRPEEFSLNSPLVQTFQTFLHFVFEGKVY